MTDWLTREVIQMSLLILGLAAAVCALGWLISEISTLAVLAWARDKGLKPAAAEIKQYVPMAIEVLFGIK